MNTDLYVRATFVIERSVAEKLAFVARRMGRSRSDLVREVITEPADIMFRLAQHLPEPGEAPSPDMRQLMLDGLGPLEDMAREFLSEARVSLGGSGQ